MVKYVTMRRITQILASILSAITVLTIYLAFDFAINNALNKKNARNHQHDHHHHDDEQEGHNHLVRENKSFKNIFQKKNDLTLHQGITRSLSLPHPIDDVKQLQRWDKNKTQVASMNLNDGQQVHQQQQTRRRSRNSKQNQGKSRVIKGKTGVKVNQPVQPQMKKHKTNRTLTVKNIINTK
ncbi:unnamed protein product [Didymodactylos carnosus]|uniref:Uncharacterized protein n=1 Tax=Didymodactylos carnosus TaxID=1234261 RepID=A0A814CM39_9BILA|nr:unnamed protein product [Didymodactylos carnosus]CAF1177370.1 unnamed protein product [Didymodactylos carnosus]CAF3718353.1 unnamed protein product [Didymodactylos carnosus]CAF3988627.1 unnamed protein product [Didymodactylos carnosus]